MPRAFDKMLSNMSMLKPGPVLHSVAMKWYLNLRMVHLIALWQWIVMSSFVQKSDEGKKVSLSRF